MEKWDVSLPPVQGAKWSAMADLILMKLDAENAILFAGPFQLFPQPQPEVAYPEPVSAGGYL